MPAPKAFGRGEVEFISQYLWDRRVPAETREQFGPRKPMRDQPPCRKVRVSRAPSWPIIPADQKHPAAGQFGLFAAQTLAPGAHVMDYLGLVMLYEHCNAGTG